MNKDRHIVLEAISTALSAIMLFPHNLRLWLKFAVVCAWCGRHMRGFRFGPITSHGICPRCSKRMTTDLSDYAKRTRN